MMILYTNLKDTIKNSEFIVNKMFLFELFFFLFLKKLYSRSG